MVVQNYLLFEHRSVLGNLTSAARQAEMSSTDAKAASMRYLKRFGLAEHAGKYPIQISGGWRARARRRRAGVPGRCDGR